ncbi:Peptidase M30, hyicolysin [Gemmatirosa kalamazoonensis]|uniref:Peptidase M30, hyicolysin n=1 Tax=Gemmatirosa kalamazoonensis TaxID=861299 RepID=W0RDZ5_9BACT|nr:Ig-like domain-containing protein [Gemmatirosa kalamazoonensis]AHG89031.1 Peptidase M30, hyicolysin [Gemmatirosa kalamazoonensis]
MSHSAASNDRERRAHRAAWGLLLAFGAACGGDGGARATGPSSSTSPALAAAAVSVVSGSGQTAAAGAALPAPLVVKVTTANGSAVPGATVVFQVTSGTGTVSPSSAVTDASGQASTQLTLGANAGAVQVTATVQGTTISTTLSASGSTVMPPTVTCAPAGAQSLAPGQATTVSGSSVCVAGAAGSEFVLEPFNTASDPGARAAVTVQASGVDPVTGVLASRAPVPGVSSDVVPDVVGAPAFRDAFEARLRLRRIAELTPMISAARGWYAARTSSTLRRSVIPGNVSVGTVVRLNANSDLPCSNPDYRGGVVVAVSGRAIVVADTLNPTGGFTTADYQSIATTFDTLVDAIDTRNFGQPTDIDGNGHVIMFFTSAVNALTPRNSDAYVGGFFDSRDLFPTRATRDLPACATSNVGEMFYLLVPDPTGMVNGNRFTKSFITRVTIATVAHEYQHLINSSRRLYVNTQSVGFEEPWLDEGLAHIAEELLFYARAGLGPGRDIDAPTLRSSTTITNAFGDDGIENFDRFGLYLQNTVRNSPYADNDSLETRGAAWSFLRYAADRVQPAAQETLWQKIVNSNAVGLTNLRQSLGTDPAALFRDWGVMLALDDVPGADARYQMQSWNLRSVFAMPNVDGSYPLRTTPVASGTPIALGLPGGTGAYLRFTVGAGKAGALSWNALPQDVLVTLVRLR